MNPKELKKLKEKYLNAPNHCPFCDSDELDSEGPHFHDENQIRVLVSCDNCEASWFDIFTLISVYFGEQQEGALISDALPEKLAPISNVAPIEGSDEAHWPAG